MQVKFTPERIFGAISTLGIAMTYSYVLGFFRYVGMNFVSMLELQSFAVVALLSFAFLAMVAVGGGVAFSYAHAFTSSRQKRSLVYSLLYGAMSLAAVVVYASQFDSLFITAGYVFGVLVLAGGIVLSVTASLQNRILGASMAVLYLFAVAASSGILQARKLVNAAPNATIVFKSGENAKASVVMIGGGAVLFSEISGDKRLLRYVSKESIQEINTLAVFRVNTFGLRGVSE